MAREVVTTDEPEAPPGVWYLKYCDEIFDTCSTYRARGFDGQNIGQLHLSVHTFSEQHKGFSELVGHVW